MWPAMFWKLGHFLCSNISLDFFLMSELWRLAFLLAVQSIPKNTTWVLWLGDWRFFKQLFITNKLQKWWKLAFLCIFCMKIAFTLMHFILQTTFNTSTNLWLKSQLSTYLSLFLEVVTFLKQFCLIFWWKYHTFCKKLQLTGMWKLKTWKTAFWCQIRLLHMKLFILTGQNDWKMKKKWKKWKLIFHNFTNVRFKTWKINVKKSEFWHQIRVPRAQLPI